MVAATAGTGTVAVMGTGVMGTGVMGTGVTAIRVMGTVATEFTAIMAITITAELVSTSRRIMALRIIGPHITAAMATAVTTTTTDITEALARYSRART